MLVISPQTQRRFILGTQGLYPARRWAGKEGVLQALLAGCVVQIDPLNVVARSPDIVLYGRVLDYRLSHLEELLYTDRRLFEYGGTVMIHPMEELPYWRVVMARKQNERRWVTFAETHGKALEDTRLAVAERGPLGARDLAGGEVIRGNYRSKKDTGLALYYLWLAGEVMIHSRRGSDKIYDLSERIAPAQFRRSASADEAEDYFALKVFREGGILTQRSWRNRFQGTVERKVEKTEAAARLDALIESGRIVQVGLQHDPREPRFVLADQFPLLEQLHSGEMPSAWRPIDPAAPDEMVFLAPLEITTARGRAMPLFGFEYLWEVYKPQEQRRWGYYVLPILHCDNLVARFEPVLQRASRTLLIKGFWPEQGVVVDEGFAFAFAAGLRRFTSFVGAESVQAEVDLPAAIRVSLVHL